MEIRNKIWDYCRSRGMSDAGAAGIMGNIEAESAFKPNNVENRCPMSDLEYTAAVDSGEYRYFSRDAYGYGLCQWTYPTRKAALLSFAKSRGVSVADADMQLDFMANELEVSYPQVWKILTVTDSVKAASEAVMKLYENPADQSAGAVAYRAALGEKIFAEFAAKAEKSITVCLPELYTGSVGGSVAAMQALLNMHGSHIAADGIFGAETLAALKDFQSECGLISDGICGALSWGRLLRD